MTPIVFAGGMLTGCAALAGATLGPGHPAATWLLVVALGGCGLLLATRPARVDPPSVAAVAATVAAQLAGGGLAAARAPGAAPFVVAGMLATCAAAAIAWRPAPAPRRAWLAALLGAALVLPPLLVFAETAALRYVLPWGGALLATGWLEPSVARTVRITILACAVTVGLAAAAGVVGTAV